MNNEADDVTIIESATCLGCGCACDDISVVVRGGRIVEARNACHLGVKWFGDGTVSTGVTVRGESVPVERALDEASALLGGARRALVYLAPDISCEAQRAAVALADQLHAVVDNITSSTAAAGTLAAQRRGRASATLGEVRNRADVLVFWGVDPAERYPRYLTRYAPDPAGVFVPGGRSDRTVIAVDVGDEHGPADADVRIAIAPGDEPTAIAMLRATLAGRGPALGDAGKGGDAGKAGDTGKAGDAAKAGAIGNPGETANTGTTRTTGTTGTTGNADPVARTADTPTATQPLAELALILAGARYAVVVYDAEPGKREHPGRAESLIALTQELNATIRCSLSTLRGGGNRGGAETVMTWQTGFPMTVDYSRGAPRYRPDEGAAALLERGAVDVVLIVGNARAAGVPDLGEARCVAIGPWSSQFTPAREVAIDTGVAGIHEGGLAYRMDDIPLPLRPSLPGPAAAPDTAALLAALGARLRARTQQGTSEGGSK
ncbi:MAG TPA: hypothetical protein VIQ74_09600 [Gemmatimonadaceae bacterium]